MSHTGSHNPRLVSREEAGGKKGEGEEEEGEGERRKKTLRTESIRLITGLKKMSNTDQLIPWKERKEELRQSGSQEILEKVFQVFPNIKRLILHWEEDEKKMTPKLHA